MADLKNVKIDNVQLETFEWDNVWFEYPDNSEAKRFIYIGDSISVGTRGWIKGLSDNRVLCDGFGTSKALDNPFFKPSLELFILQEKAFDGILINNGLHGWHLSCSEYARYYEDMLDFLAKTGKPIYLLLSTHLPADPERNEIVCQRNEAAKAIAEKRGIAVIDLYSVSVAHCDLYTEDKVHFVDEGYKLLAQCILGSVG